MRTAGKKRANSARRRPADLNSVLMALTLVLGVSAIRATCELGAHAAARRKSRLSETGLTVPSLGTDELSLRSKKGSFYVKLPHAA